MCNAQRCRESQLSDKPAAKGKFRIKGVFQQVLSSLGLGGFKRFAATIFDDTRFGKAALW